MKQYTSTVRSYLLRGFLWGGLAGFVLSCLYSLLIGLASGLFLGYIAAYGSRSLGFGFMVWIIELFELMGKSALVGTALGAMSGLLTGIGVSLLARRITLRPSRTALVAILVWIPFILPITHLFSREMQNRGEWWSSLTSWFSVLLWPLSVAKVVDWWAYVGVPSLLFAGSMGGIAGFLQLRSHADQADDSVEDTHQRFNITLTSAGRKFRFIAGGCIGLTALCIASGAAMPGLLDTYARSLPTPSPTPDSMLLIGARTLANFPNYTFGPPVWSHDGNTIAVTRGPYRAADGLHDYSSNEGDVILIDVESGSQSLIYSAEANGWISVGPPLFWLSDNKHLIWTQSGTIVFYDIQSKTQSPLDCRCGPIALNRDETEALVVGYPNNTIIADWLNLSTGQLRREFSFPYTPTVLSLSPDDKQLIIGERGGDLSLYAIGSGALPTTILINTQAEDAAWSPDGSKIAYVDVSGGGYGIIRIANADGSSPEPLTPPLPAGQFAPAWSPDGTQIAFLYGNRNRQTAVVIADVPEHLRPTSRQAGP